MESLVNPTLPKPSARPVNQKYKLPQDHARLDRYTCYTDHINPKTLLLLKTCNHHWFALNINTQHLQEKLTRLSQQTCHATSFQDLQEPSIDDKLLLTRDNHDQIHLQSSSLHAHKEAFLISVHCFCNRIPSLALS